jgi:ribonucleoside-diphosphate reductase alpha chain
VEPLTPNAKRVLESRYLLRDRAGRLLEDWEGLCRRVADAVSAPERSFGGDPAPVGEAFFEMLRDRVFLPNSPTLMNAGTSLPQLAACFVLPVEDTLESIFGAVARMAAIHQSGGGTGFDFSRLRPAGDPVARTRGIASGPVSFMRVFDCATSVVKEGGRRRGANMGVLRVDHPDVDEFIRVKSDPSALQNFNISVATTQGFWEAVERGASWELLHPRDRKAARTVDARALLAEIARQAWATGDPGVVFLDAIERDNPTPAQGALEATNPCGELPLLPNEACNLGSIRVDAFVRGAELDWQDLGRCIDLAVRFLDDVIEVSEYPFPEIAERVHANRKIGLGVMGFADLLVDLGVPYASDEAVALADRLMAFVRARAEAASAQLAEERGVFPSWAESRLAERGLRLRHATVTSIAPTGTLSILAGCSSGIEPYFALAFVRRVLDGARLPETVPRFERALRAEGLWSEDLATEVRETGSIGAMVRLPEPVRRLFATAPEISAEQHLAIQAAFQRHVDNAVSKTINLPRSATPHDVEAIYRSAWRRQLKGVTVFREGARGSAVLERGERGALEAPAEHGGGCKDDRCP